MSRRAGSSTRGQSSLVLAAVLVLTSAGWTGGARAALAHEFKLAVVTPASGTANAGLSGRDVLDGFRLAVDRSPDVSHPAGPDAGDHLGGIDVDVTVIDGTDAADAGEAVIRELDAGLTTVVVIASARTARAVTTELEGSPVLVVTATGAGASAPADAGALQLQQRSGPPYESAMAAEIAAAFTQAYGRDLSAAAALGYDAGRLLDAAIAGADDGIEDLDAVVAAGSAVDDILISADVATPDRATAERAPALRKQRQTRGRAGCGRWWRSEQSPCSPCSPPCSGGARAATDVAPASPVRRSGAADMLRSGLSDRTVAHRGPVTRHLCTSCTRLYSRSSRTRSSSRPAAS